VQGLWRLDARLDRDQGLRDEHRRWRLEFLYRKPKLRLGLLLSAPLLWLGLAYLGALAALFVTAF
jgi:putative spermidine/putrescine transport system permease protein